MRISRPALIVVLLATAGCGSSTPTQPTSTTPTTISELFSGTLDVGGSTFYSFAVSQSGLVQVMLASITNSTGQPQPTPLHLGVGIPSGTDCGVTTSVDATPALAAQISNAMSSGTYCVSLSDQGTLRGLVNFSVRIVHP